MYCGHISILDMTISRLIFLGILPVVLVSILNLYIYLAIVRAGQLVVSHSLQAQKGGVQLEMLRRNYSSGTSCENRASRVITPFSDIKTETDVIVDEENTVVKTYNIIASNHKTSDASADNSDDDKVSMDSYVDL